MKKTNKILNLVMAMIFICLSMVCVSAEDIAENDEYIEFFENDITVNASEEIIKIDDSIGIDEEIMPMAANECENTHTHKLTASTKTVWCNICGKEGSLPIKSCTVDNCSYYVITGAPKMGCECIYSDN